MDERDDDNFWVSDFSETPEQKKRRIQRLRDGRETTHDQAIRTRWIGGYPEMVDYENKLKSGEWKIKTQPAAYNRGFFEDLAGGVKAAAKDIGLKRGGRIHKVGHFGAQNGMGVEGGLRARPDETHHARFRQTLHDLYGWTGLF